MRKGERLIDVESGGLIEQGVVPDKQGTALNPKRESPDKDY